MKKLLIVDPASVWAEEEAVVELSSLWEGEVEVIRPALEPGRATLHHRADAFVLLGSRASVYEPHGWIRATEVWLDPILKGQVRRPLLAICFGHQLVAKVVGAEVRFRDPSQEKLQGFLETRRTRQSRFLPADSMLVLANHAEEVVSAPKDFVVAASRESCQIDALEHHTLPILTTQFHPEARGEFCEHVEMPFEQAPKGLVEDARALLGAFFALA